MTQKETLIDIISNYDCTACSAKEFAEYLINNGVVVLPCKVGDNVYILTKPCLAYLDGIIESEILSFRIAEDGISVISYSACFNVTELDRLGKTVFLTSEEAEEALRGAET